MSVVIPSLRGAIAVPGWAKNDLWRRARAVPSLDLRFADNKSLTDAVTGASLVTFTRASSGTFVGSAGVIQTAATDVPRFDHNPTTGESLGLLVEEQRTNLLLWSEEFSDAAWTPLSVPAAVTANNAIAPNGTLTADLITGVSAAADQLQQVVTVLNSTVYTYSIYIKQNTTPLTRIGLFNATASTWMGAVDIAWVAGVPSTSSTIGSPSGISYVAANNGWYRCSFALTTTATSAQVHFHPDRSNTQASAWTWGAQLEAGAFPSSYIPTTTAAATRSADLASITGSNFSSWYRQDEGAMFINGVLRGILSQNYVVSISAGASGANAHVVFGVSGALRYSVAVSSNLQVNIALGSASVDDQQFIAASYQQNNFAAARNGVLGPSDTLGNLPTVDTLKIGTNFNNGAAFSGHIRRLVYWGQRLPNNVLQAITQ
jgi:hypothetical protein